MSSTGTTKSLRNKAQMARNEKVTFHAKAEFALQKPYQSDTFDEKLITRGSIYGHFARGRLPRGRTRDRNLRKT